MKNTLLAISFLLAMVSSWLFFTLIWTVFSDLSYLETLKQPEQMIGLMFLYWWFPGVFILSDLDNW